MRVPLTEVGRRGRLDLVFGRRGDQTFLRDSYCEVPFKITRTLSVAGDGVAHLMLMHCTAGLFGGDSMEMTVHVERGARVRLTQQSATRVHPSEDRWAIQSNRIHVESGGELDLLFEPIIPFAASRLRQTTSIDVEPGGRLLFWEGLMAGRVGRGEVWEFKDLSYETRLTSEARLLFLDRFHLRPDRFSPSSDWRMEKATYAGTGLYLGSDPGKFAEGLHTALPMAGVDVLSDDLAVMRVVTCHGPEFHRWREVFATTRPAR